ncbi:AMSH-like ubiquitin thioesterase 3-like [Trifolium medium]|uniref:AMSH-like ubiquitin thioesterase 3-like n=1 Tax=Trifolium medium TaxID=97028 RepID=A0A392MXC7_9FABA|nr:AMSH-like ubiquitin thioesterase 3-like [Trifolium medium]
MVSETIPYHRDYQASLPNERTAYKRRSLLVLDEVESLKPEFKRRLDKLNESRVQAPLPEENGFNMAMQSPANSSLEWPAVNKRYNSSMDFKHSAGLGSQSSSKPNNTLSTISTPIDKQFQKLGGKMGKPVSSRPTTNPSKMGWGRLNYDGGLNISPTTGQHKLNG